MQKVALEASPTDLVIIQECLRLAGEIVAQTEITQTSGQLRTMQDLVMVQSTMLARFLTEVGKRYVISWLNKDHLAAQPYTAETCDLASQAIVRVL